MSKSFLILITIFISFSSITSAQTKKFRWTTEFCEFEGTYDAKKYTAVQLKNMQRLIGNDFDIDTASATIWKYEDIKALNFAPVEAEYKRKSAELKSLNIVKTLYWESRRQQKLKELEHYYLLAKATMSSYLTPQSLRNYPFAQSCQTKYAEPLITGNDSLLKIWETVNIETRKNNADPARIKRIFDEQHNSPDALKFAVVEVTSFGWWNCANALIDQGDAYDVREKNFNKLFTRVKTIRCDEP